MRRIVVKFGGTSLGDYNKIKNAAKIVKKRFLEGNEMIVVVSAMAGVTNELVEKSKSISNDFDKSEFNVLLSTGEQTSCALMAGALIDLGLKARSWLSWQIPIITEDNHSSSRIINIKTEEIAKELSENKVIVIPGFQGVSTNGRLTTIGRGGSDATAVAVAKFLSADSCEIYTDVEGVFTTDPSVNSKAKKIDKISFEEMLEMSSLGAKVMQSSAVQAAMIHDIPIKVKSSFSEGIGTEIISENFIDYKKAITGVAYSKNDAKITLIGVVDKPGVAATIFEPISNNNINIDMVIQSISADGKETDITFTIKREDLKTTINLIKKNKSLNYKKIIHNEEVAKISIIGAGMISSPGVTHRMFRALADENINILAISTSEIKISVLINEKFTQKATKVLHKVFKLD